MRADPRRLVLLGLLTGLSLLGPLAAVALADDCSSPSDCSNTAWTVGVGAAITAGIIGAAAAAGALGGEQVGAGDREAAKECDELPEIEGNARATFERLAAMAGNRDGALRLHREALQAAERIRHRLAAAIPGYAQLGQGLGLGSAGATGTVRSVGLARSSEQAMAAARQWQRLRANYRALEIARGHALPAAGVAEQKAAQLASKGGKLSKAGTALSVGGAGLTFIGHVLEDMSNDEIRALGAAEVELENKLAEALRWRDYANELQQGIDAGLDELRGLAGRHEQIRTAHNCPRRPIDVAQLEGLLAKPPAADLGVTAPLPETLLERTPVQRGERQDVTCGTYDAMLAAYETRRGNAEPTLERYERELRTWMTRKVTLDAMTAAVGQAQTELHGKLYGIRDTLNVGGRVVELTAAIMACFPASWPVLALCGGVGIVTMLARGEVTPTQAELLLEGQLKAKMRFLQSRYGYLRAEVGRITTLRDALANELDREYHHLTDVYERCSGVAFPGHEPYWKTPHRPPTRIDLRHRRTPDWLTIGVAPPNLSTPAGVAQTWQEIRTWR